MKKKTGTFSSQLVDAETYYIELIEQLDGEIKQI